jgi:hypothetical protein
VVLLHFFLSSRATCGRGERKGWFGAGQKCSHPLRVVTERTRPRTETAGRSLCRGLGGSSVVAANGDGVPRCERKTACSSSLPGKWLARKQIPGNKGLSRKASKND